MRASLVAQLVKNLPAMQETPVRFLGREDLGDDRLPTRVFLGFPGGSEGKESACNVGIPGFGPWVGKIPWRREWLPTPVFLPGEFHGQRSLVGYSPWGRKQDMTEWFFTFPGNRLFSYISTLRKPIVPQYHLIFSPYSNLTRLIFQKFWIWWISNLWSLGSSQYDSCNGKFWGSWKLN